MTAPRDCRPPDGTPDGTVCWLKNRNLLASAEWDSNINDHWAPEESEPGVWWCRLTDWYLSPVVMHRKGWRFHSIAEPPHD